MNIHPFEVPGRPPHGLSMRHAGGRCARSQGGALSLLLMHMLLAMAWPRLATGQSSSSVSCEPSTDANTMWAGNNATILTMPSYGEMYGVTEIDAPVSVDTKLVAAMRVTLNITHDSPMDISVFLQYPGSTCARDKSNKYVRGARCIELMSLVGAVIKSEVFSDTSIISDKCSSFWTVKSLWSDTMPYAGDHRASSYIYTTWEMPAYGTAGGAYRLLVYDNYAGYGGMLLGWSLQLFFYNYGSGAAPPLPPVTYLPPAPPPPDVTVSVHTC